MAERTSVASLLLAALFVANALIFGAPVSAATASCSSTTDPFSVTSTYWGTPGAPQSVYPGAQDAPFTVTLLFAGPCSSPSNTFQLLLSQGNNPSAFTGQNGNTQPELVTLNVAANTVVTETFYLDVSPSAQTSSSGITYTFPMDIQYQSDNASNPLTQVLSVPLSLYGEADLKVSSTATSIAAGQTDTVPFTVSNAGSGASGQVATSVAGPTSATVLGQPPTVASLAPGANASESVQLFVPSSLSGSTVTLTFTTRYVDGYGNSQTVTQNLVFNVGGSAPSSSSFLVEGASWGSAGSASSPLPGSQDEPLVVSLQYLGATPVTSLQGTLTLPQGFSNLNGQGSAVAYSSATTAQYGALTLTFDLDVSGTVQPGSYNFTLGLQWMTSQSSGLVESATITPPPVASLQSYFQVESTSWQVSSLNASSVVSLPTVGTQGQPLVVTLQNLGAVSASGIEGTIALPQGMTSLNDQQTATAFSASAAADQVVTLTFYLDLGSALQPGSYSFPLALSWLSPTSTRMTQNTTVSPPPVAAETATSSVPLTLVQENSIVTVGTTTSASFVLTNDGSLPIESPTFTLVPGASVVVTSVGSSVPTGVLAPGKNATFTAQVTSDTSTTPGIYSGTLEVTYTDSSGSSHAQSFPVSFTVEGTVILVLQDTQASQSVTGFTVTGTILNEGTAPAYYASIGGLLGSSSATPSYLGEIDPNTPLPFSVTIPFTAPLLSSQGNASSSATTTFSRSRSGAFPGLGGNFSFPAGFNGTFFGRNSTAAGTAATITLSLSFKNTFGNLLDQSFPVQTTIESASQLSTGTGLTSLSGASGGSPDLKYAAYGMVVIIVASLVVGAVMLRRHRGLAGLPQEARGDQSVI
ncbi:MAG: hypothetical protein JRN03_08530 [Nitrososphaerota archaeon]|nr:hypothetical protein [Nitrososphaerota archaeon]